MTVETNPERASELSGLTYMAISGGAILPLMMGRLGGGGAAFAYQLFLSLWGGQKVEA